MSGEYLCVHCHRPTENYADHVERHPDHGTPVLPVRWISGWKTDASYGHAHATRFEREAEGRGRFGGGTEYRFGIVADRVCWPCNSVMPHSVCEVVPV